jgi:hypothetical protein
VHYSISFLHSTLFVHSAFEAVERSSWMEEHMTFWHYCDGHLQALQNDEPESLYFGPLMCTSHDESHTAVFLALPVIETFIVSIIVCAACIVALLLCLF